MLEMKSWSTSSSLAINHQIRFIICPKDDSPKQAAEQIVLNLRWLWKIAVF